MNTEFKEVQKFTQWWLWLIIIGIGMLPIYGIYKQFILGEKFGTNPMSNTGLVFFIIFVFGLIALFLLMKLKTEINENEVKIKFVPFITKSIKWNEIKNAEVINYGFVGWGIKIGTKYGTVYNTKGKIGLSIKLKNGKKLLIGTQKEAELKNVIDKIINS